jgi:hypothetical protein
MEEDIKPIYILVGNIIAERHFGPDKEIRKGTKHFSGGTKVYIIDWYPGMCETIVVIGIHRKSKKLIKNCIKVDKVENLRVKKIYSLSLLKKIKELACLSLTEESALQMFNVIPIWQEALKNESNENLLFQDDKR